MTYHPFMSPNKLDFNNTDLTIFFPTFLLKGDDLYLIIETYDYYLFSNVLSRSTRVYKTTRVDQCLIYGLQYTLYGLHL